MEGALTRVLLADSGALARHQIALWAERRVESVVAVDVSAAECAWPDEADYAVWNGAEGAEMPTASRLVGAAMDAGCDAIDGGALADDLDLMDLAVRSNLVVVGTDPHSAARWTQPEFLTELATAAKVPFRFGSEEDPTLQRRLDVLVLVDRPGNVSVLGALERSCGPTEDAPWLIEFGAVLGDGAWSTLRDSSRTLCHQGGAPGLVRVQWQYLAQSGWTFRGMRAALPPGSALVEPVAGVDLSRLRLNAWFGGSGVIADLEAERHGVQARVVALEEGEVAQTLPEGFIADVEAHQPVFPGQPLGAIQAVGPSRQAALVQLRAQLEALPEFGVATNAEALVAASGRRDWWDGRFGVAESRDFFA